MDSRIEQACERHHKGYNCAQAVVCTYADLFGVDENTAYRMSESFGFGMGSQEVCGALTGALMVLGLKNSGGMEQPGATKAVTYRHARVLTEKFREATGALLCREIKTQPPLCSCDRCVECGARLVEQEILYNV